MKRELPRLRADLDEALATAQSQLGLLGNRRATLEDCKPFMTQLSREISDICKAAVNGNYEGDYFDHITDQSFSLSSPATLRRLRAAIQYMNTNFSSALRTSGHKFQIARKDITAIEILGPNVASSIDEANHDSTIPKAANPIKLSSSQALKWAEQVLLQTRGAELSGSFNPLVIGELFWEQSSNWKHLAADHVDQVAYVCSQFLEALLFAKAPKDVCSRLWVSHIQDTLKSRREKAIGELKTLVDEIQKYPINYNHYYTDTIQKQRQDRFRETLTKSIQDATTQNMTVYSAPTKTYLEKTTIDAEQVVKQYFQYIDPDMDKYSCEEALDCMLAIYKVRPRNSRLYLPLCYYT